MGASLDRLYERIQEKYDIKTVSETEIRDFIYHGKQTGNDMYSHGLRGGKERPKVDADVYRRYRNTEKLSNSDINDFMKAPRIYQSPEKDWDFAGVKDGSWKEAAQKQYENAFSNILGDLTKKNDVGGLSDLYAKTTDTSRKQDVEVTLYNTIQVEKTAANRARDVEKLNELRDYAGKINASDIQSDIDGLLEKIKQ